MGALANYTYAERLSAGMPGHLMTSVTHGWVHEAAFTADGSPSGVQASDNWRMQGSGMPGIAFVLARGKEWIVSPKGASTSEGSAVGSERHIATPRAMAQNFIDDLYNGVPQRQLHKLGVCTVAGKAGVLYGVWRPHPQLSNHAQSVRADGLAPDASWWGAVAIAEVLKQLVSARQRQNVIRDLRNFLI
ncbi:MAG: hypothetical protein ACYDCY_02700 [Metallibacterium sp.]